MNRVLSSSAATTGGWAGGVAGGWFKVPGGWFAPGCSGVGGGGGLRFSYSALSRRFCFSRSFAQKTGSGHDLLPMPFARENFLMADTDPDPRMPSTWPA